MLGKIDLNINLLDFLIVHLGKNYYFFLIILKQKSVGNFKVFLLTTLFISFVFKGWIKLIRHNKNNKLYKLFL